MVVKSTFIVVRHGETTWNRSGRIQGHLDSPLSVEGLFQAEALSERLSKEKFDVLVSSDLGRAHETAQCVARRTGHGVLADPRLRERHYGIFQGMTRNEANSAFPEIYAQYNAESVTFAIPEGESTQECFVRNLECLEELAVTHLGQRVVVVTHGGVLDGLYRHVMKLPHVGSRAFTIVNASLNWFTYEDGQWRLDCWGDVAHLGVHEALDDV